MASAPLLPAGLGLVRFDRNFKAKFHRGPFFQKHKCLFVVSSVLDKSRGKVNGYRPVRHNDNAMMDPAVERLLAQTHRFEQQTDLKSNLKSDLTAAVEELKSKEDQLRDSEMALDLGRREVRRLHNHLTRREKNTAKTLALQAKLQQELEKSRDDYGVLVCELDNIKICLRQREGEVFSAQQALAAKERELEMLRGELQKKDEQLAQVGLDFRCKDHLLSEANLVIQRQQGEITEMQRLLTERENDLLASQKKREEEEEKLKIAENILEERWVATLVAQQTTKELVHEICKYQGIALVADEDLQRVRGSLSAVKEELGRSQRSLEESRNRLAAQQTQIGEQQQEIFIQRNAILDYQQKLRDAHLDIENEREKLMLAEQENNVLQHDLCCERRAVEELTAALEIDRTHLQESIQRAQSLESQLEKKSGDLSEIKTLLGLKESEVVAVRLEIQKLKSELSSIAAMLKDKEVDLHSARKYIEELHEEISSLKDLMGIKEDDLFKAKSLLEEKDTKMNVMQLDLDKNKIRLSQAENIVVNIAELTNTLVGAATDGRSLSMDEDSLHIQTNCDLFSAKRALLEKDFETQKILQKREEDLKKYQQMEAEVKSVKGLLKEREKQLMDLQRALVVKDEEFKASVNRFESREKEIMKMREEVIQEANGLNGLYAIVQNKIGNKTLGELALEKLELEAAKLEAEAAMNALKNLADLSNEYLKESNELSLVERQIFDYPIVDMTECPHEAVISEDRVDLDNRIVERDMTFHRTKIAVTDLNEMTKQLFVEAKAMSSQDTQNAGKASFNDNKATKPFNKLVMAAA